MESVCVLPWLLLGALTGMREEEGRMGYGTSARPSPGQARESQREEKAIEETISYQSEFPAN